MIVEIAQFKTKPGVSDAGLLTASKKAQDGYLSRCKGFVSRELLKSGDGTWLDIVHFETAKDAENAAENFAKDPNAKEFENAIDASTAKMMHFKVAKKY
ncbi:MAG: hypothetical protein HY392_04620 [Candidatus Diapherotrites archaeon]|nr:hypothetical protein [Candidatus Diapherotrites archaeon]